MQHLQYPSLHAGVRFLQVDKVVAVGSFPGIFSVRFEDGTSIQTTLELWDALHSTVRAGIVSAQTEAVAS